MKKKLTMILAMLLSACTETVTLPPSVTNAIPEKYDITAPAFARQKAELEELVADCGPGVVVGAKGELGAALENRCQYQVDMDETFFRHTADKTGLLHDASWPYQNSVVWFSPKMEAVPDAFDVRDYMKNGMPEIKTQQCGDCWAWASHHGYEIAQAVHDGKVVDNAVQTILSCSKQGTCGGGYMSAVDFIRHGLPLENANPYQNGVTGSCKFGSADITTGWEPKVFGTPNVGNSMQYSRALKMGDGTFSAKPSVEAMQQAMFQWKSPLVVTVSAYNVSGDGVVDSCRSINSGGNHMVTIVGWDNEGGTTNAHVWNSWGKAHGKNGVSRIKWECGAGKLNRGLGVSAKVVQYKSQCEPADATIGKAKHVILTDSSVRLGNRTAKQSCKWSPTDGLDDPNACETYAHPSVSTEYHLTATNDCGITSSMTLVEVWGPTGTRPVPNKILTPFGMITVPEEQ